MVVIFVEGKEDRKFIEDYLGFLSESRDLIDFQVKDIGGWTKLELTKNLLEENTDSDGVNLLIFDADSENNNGGFINRQQNLFSIREELSIEFDLFLFPNNQDDGDFESLLERIINLDHSCLLDCFNSYETCLNSQVDNNGNCVYDLPLRKAKIYSYVDAFPKSRREEEKFKKGDFFYSNPNFWNLSSDNLEELKNFLLERIENI